MRKEDLMIGMNVFYDDKITNINSGDFNDRYEFNPINATPEIFLNIGFKEVKEDLGLRDGNEFVSYEANINSYYVTISNRTIDKQWYVRVDTQNRLVVGGMEFDYIHEFQIFLKLVTGKMIEIKTK